MSRWRRPLFYRILTYAYRGSERERKKVKQTDKQTDRQTARGKERKESQKEPNKIMQESKKERDRERHGERDVSKSNCILSMPSNGWKDAGTDGVIEGEKGKGGEGGRVTQWEGDGAKEGGTR